MTTSATPRTRKPKAEPAPTTSDADEAQTDTPERAVSTLSVEELEARIAELEALLAETPTTATRPRNVVEAIIAVMREVRAVGKDGRNEQQGFNFRGIDGVLNAVGPAMRKVGLLCTPGPRTLTTEEIVTRNGAKMAHQLLDITYVFRYSDAEGDITTLDVPVYGESMDSGDKSVSKAFSVAYRTCLIQTLSLPTTEKDPDEDVYDRGDAPDPKVLAELQAKAQALFTLPLDQVRAASAPFSADEQTWALMEHVTVTVDGQEVPAKQALRELAQKVMAAEQAAAAAAQAAATESAPAAEQPAPAVESQPEPAAATELTSEQQAAKDAAHAEVDANAQAAAEADPKRRQIQAWLGEVDMQAGILGRTPGEVVQPLVTAAEVQDAYGLPAKRLADYVVKVRAKAIAVLREAGRATEAERYEQLPVDQPARAEQVLDAQPAAS